jgi:putative copper export protein
MSSQLIGFGIITFLHDLFTAIWIGGLIAMGITTLPSIKQVLGKSPQTRQLMDTIQRRQSVLVYLSIVGLIITGLLQARRVPSFEGIFTFNTAYSAVLAFKHILVLGMVLIALYRNLVLGRTNGPLALGQEKLSGILLILNIIFGITVLLLSGFLVALASGPPGV